LVARHAAGVLAISHFAIDYYTRLGFCKERVYAFGYFRANSDLPDNPERLVNKRTEVIFIGQIIPRKGLDILLEAMLPLFTEYPSLCLTLVGDGEDIPTLRTRVHSLGLHERVALEGVIPSDQIQTRLAAADVLVLPSRWDGWGLVVNEAFSVGTPVIVSDRCGAADLIKQGVNGYVFRSENLEELRSCLRSFLNTGSWTTLKSAAARTGQAISTEIVTPYMIECLQHLTNGSGNRPIPPWIQLAIPQTED
jgi:glycosyltransferase involved in cell wall biosynthesis